MVFDVVVVGGGHAGVEASLASARLGLKTALVTIDRQALGRMSCNPAIGGLAKGHLVREVDALGGEMGFFSDRAGIQFKMLNKSKGKAVWSPRAQVDKKLYERLVVSVVKNQKGLTIIEAEARSVHCVGTNIKGIALDCGLFISCLSAVLTCGTFLNGVIHVGNRKISAGRMGEESSDGITESLLALGFTSGRLKTGTPPRLRNESICWEKASIVCGDKNPRPFSFRTRLFDPPNVPCYLVNTNPLTHEIIAAHLSESPMFSGQISGVGPRYCPSIEDKVVRFADRTSHNLFLEPEWKESTQIYTNGFSTSLPEHVQLKALRTVSGLEKVSFYRPGYAIEYDFFLPSQLKSSLETKDVNGLFFAGQLNGTSGYEEAAAQGLVAGINAARFALERPPVVLRRDQAYIGVLIDDLVTKETLEPYRMFTAHAEHRLLLRHTNADLRLSSLAHSIGLIKDTTFEPTQKKQALLSSFVFDAIHTRPPLNKTNAFLRRINQHKTSKRLSVAELLRRPEVSLEGLIQNSLVSLDCESFSKECVLDFLDEAETTIKYEGYISRQNALIERLSKNEGAQIPSSFEYSQCLGVSLEAREKLSLVRPQTLGQASRISGVSPADVAALSLFLASS